MLMLPRAVLTGDVYMVTGSVYMVGPNKDLESRFARACYGSRKEGFGDCPERDGGGGMRD